MWKKPKENTWTSRNTHHCILTEELTSNDTGWSIICKRKKKKEKKTKEKKNCYCEEEGNREKDESGILYSIEKYIAYLKDSFFIQEYEYWPSLEKSTLTCNPHWYWPVCPTAAKATG